MVLTCPHCDTDNDIDDPWYLLCEERFACKICHKDIALELEEDEDNCHFWRVVSSQP